MAAITDTVRPGDVISSDLINRIITLLNEHDALIASGGGGSATNLLTGFNPPAKQNVGKTLTVFGTFDLPLASNALTIDGLPIAPGAFLLGSSATQLVFIIPTSIVVSGTSKPTKVRVVNSQGSGELDYTLEPQTAALPDPTISAAVNQGTGTVPLRSGQKAIITGKNFASPANLNVVRLIVNPGAPNQVAFPATAGTSLVVDVAGSTINPAPADSTLVVTMPALDATIIPAVGQQAPASIELTAPGTNNATLSGFNIRRTA